MVRTGAGRRSARAGSAALLLAVAGAAGSAQDALPALDAKVEAWLDHPFMQWHALTGFPFGKAWRYYGHIHPLGDDWSITLAGNMAVMPLDRVLDLCRQVPRRRAADASCSDDADAHCD